MKMAFLEISNLSLTYETKNFQALSQINFFLNQGEIILITGPTGCGKSTLAHSINGIIPYAIPAEIKGSIKINSEEIIEWDVKQRALKIGTIFQNPETQLFGMTVEDDVAFGPENLGLPREEIRERVDSSLKTSGLNNLKDRFIFHLSGGQKQRLAISGILAMKPDILIFDEPTSDLDPLGTREIVNAIHYLAKNENKAIILIEHKLQDIIEIIDRMYIMDQGRFLIEGEPHNVYTKHFSKILELGINIPIKFYPNDMKLRTKHAEKINNGILLSLKNLNFKYNTNQVLKNINIEVHRGDFIALLGPNGSGKTTLVQNIIGLLRPESGTICFKNKDIKKKKAQEISREIGYLFQNPSHQIFLNNVFDELTFGLKNRKIPKEDIEKEINLIAKKLELESLLNKPTHILSRGQAQRVAMASIMLLKTELIILDEPTTGQDYRNRKEIMELMKKLNEEGITIILITHDIDLAFDYANRILLMDNGNVIADDTPDNIFSNKSIIKRIGFRQPKILEGNVN